MWQKSYKEMDLCPFDFKLNTEQGGIAVLAIPVTSMD